MLQADVVARQTQVDGDHDQIGDRQTTSHSIVCRETRDLKLEDLDQAEPALRTVRP
jgi:hypothetical protein